MVSNSVDGFANKEDPDQTVSLGSSLGLHYFLKAMARGPVPDP